MVNVVGNITVVRFKEMGSNVVGNITVIRFKEMGSG